MAGLGGRLRKRENAMASEPGNPPTLLARAYTPQGLRTFKKANWLDFLLVMSAVSDIWVIQQVGVKADLKLLSLLRMLRLALLAHCPGSISYI